MKKYRKTLSIAAAAVILLLIADYLLVSGSEFSWAEAAHDEAAITVEVMDESGVKTLAIHELTRGQGVALQSLLLRTKYLRPWDGFIQTNGGEKACKIDIRFPDAEINLRLLGGRYLLGSEGTLKILDPDWETAFNGILATG